MRTLILLFILSLTTILVNCQISDEAESALENRCTNKTTCGDCIQTKGCVWCLQPAEDYGIKPRCVQPSSRSFQYCPEEYRWNPKFSNEQRILMSRPLSRPKALWYNQSPPSQPELGDVGSSLIAPQWVSLKTRPDFVQNINFKYAQVDFPFDLYILIGRSSVSEKFSNLGEKLVKILKEITSDFRIGFGSFVDKANETSVYGFRNHMSLNTSTEIFFEKLSQVNLPGNFTSEGGSDAILQVLTCSEIGWRKNARHVLVFASDFALNLSDAGVNLTNVSTPNDGECHLENDQYTHSILQDYPTASQINKGIRQNYVRIIFAVPSSQLEAYQQISEDIEASLVARLDEDPSNVVELLREEYMKISAGVEIKDNATDIVKISYHSNCNMYGLYGLMPTKKCYGLKVGDVVEFRAEIFVEKCPEDPAEQSQIIEISPVGTNDSLIVELRMICYCPCQHPLLDEISPRCNNHGSYVCGDCRCEPGYFGKTCECSGPVNELDCRPNNTTEPICSGRGSCVCGKCECDRRPSPEEIIHGRFCECDNYSCPRNGGSVCSGTDHGVCMCGKCFCNLGWTGPDCSCSTSTETCYEPGSTEICSGRGECICGECKYSEATE